MLVYRFCIKMPILHRLACFRDDVVFLVFLYQVRPRLVASDTLGVRAHEFAFFPCSAGYIGLIPSG